MDESDESEDAEVWASANSFQFEATRPVEELCCWSIGRAIDSSAFAVSARGVGARRSSGTRAMIDETWLGTSGDTCSIGDCCCGIGTGEAAGGGTKGSADGTGTGAFMAGRSRLGVGSMNAHGSKQLMDARPNCLWNQQSFDADCWLAVVLARETRGTGTMSFGTRFVLDTGLRADDEARAGGAEAEALLDEALRLVDARLSTGWAEETFLFVAVDEM